MNPRVLLLLISVPPSVPDPTERLTPVLMATQATQEPMDTAGTLKYLACRLLDVVPSDFHMPPLAGAAVFLDDRFFGDLPDPHKACPAAKPSGVALLVQSYLRPEASARYGVHGRKGVIRVQRLRNESVDSTPPQTGVPSKKPGR